MNIRRAHMGDLDSITMIVDKSDLGSVYFNNDEEKIRKIISEEIHHQNAVLGENVDSECIAVLIYNLRGSFDIHPYIHILAVSAENRGQGYGKQLMHFFESSIAPDYKKIFLLAGVWNKKATKLYLDLGYIKLCEIPGFYTENVTEILMMKERESTN